MAKEQIGTGIKLAGIGIDVVGFVLAATLASAVVVHHVRLHQILRSEHRILDRLRTIESAEAEAAQAWDEHEQALAALEEGWRGEGAAVVNRWTAAAWFGAL
jgi:hypothetical protein